MKKRIKFFSMIAFFVIIAINTIVSCNNIDENIKIEEKTRELPKNIVKILSDNNYQQYITNRNTLKRFVKQIPQELQNDILIEYDKYIEEKDVDLNKIETIFESSDQNSCIIELFDSYLNDFQLLEEKYDLINMKMSHKRLLNKSTVYFFEQNSSKFQLLFNDKNNDLNSQMLKSTTSLYGEWWEDPYERDECVECEREALDGWDDCDAELGFTQAAALVTLPASRVTAALIAAYGIIQHNNCDDNVSNGLDDCWYLYGCP